MKLNLSLYRIYCLIFSVLICVFSYQCSANAIKIGLVTNANSAYIATSKSGSIIDAYTGRTLLSLNQMKAYQIKRNGSNIRISFNGQSYDLESAYLVVKSAQPGFVFTKNKWYRGNLIVYNTGNGLIVINDLDLESYLLGVVPAEMPSGWNIEAHKAQAIAARSYAIANLGKRARYGFDLKDTPEDQAYGGASRETLRTNNAVIQTQGQVLVYGSKVIPAYYHASSGGYTVNSGDVWLRDLPFVRAVPSFDGNIRKNGHGVGMSQHGANILANYGYSAYQILGYFYKNVKLYRTSYK